MEPQHTNDLLKHLEKQNDLLNGARNTMLQELQKLEVEEHMMMHKLKELLISHRLNNKETQIVSKEKETVEAIFSSSSSSSPPLAITNGDEEQQQQQQRRRYIPPLIHTYQRRRKKKSDSRS